MLLLMITVNLLLKTVVLYWLHTLAIWEFRKLN